MRRLFTSLSTGLALVGGGLAASILALAGWDCLAQAPAPFRLCSEEKHAQLLRLIPMTDDPRQESVRNDGRLVCYTNDEMPKASQFWDANSLAGIHDASHNISANPNPRPPSEGGGVSGGPGQEFPWRVPFGLDEATGWTQFKFYLLPVGQSVRYWRETLPPDVTPAWVWEFPQGTVFGEVLLVKDEKGQDHPFELRTRRKQGDGWRPEVYRPFRSRMELNTAVYNSTDRGAERFPSLTLHKEWSIRNRQPLKVLRRDAVEDVLPALDPDTVRRLLRRPFQSVRNHQWIPGGFAPGTREAFHIVPKNYAGAAIQVTRASCASCHKTAQKHPDDFGPPGRDWYGRVAGSDQVFSWHPFALESISRTGFPQPVKIREALLRAGHVQRGSAP